MFAGIQSLNDPRLLAALANQQEQQRQEQVSGIPSMPMPVQADAPDPSLMQKMGNNTQIDDDNVRALNREFLNSPDPYKRHVGWTETAGPNVPYPGDALPEEQHAAAMRAGGPTQHYGGLLGRLKDAAIMMAAAGPLGFAAGLINPQLAHNLRYRQLDLPLAEQQAQLARHQADQQLQQAERYGTMSGIDPYTGEPTVMGSYRNAMMGAKTRALGQRDRQLDQGDTRLDISQQQQNTRSQRLAQQFSHWKDEDFQKAYNSGALNGNPDALRAYADRIGIPGDVPDKFLAGAIKQTIDANYNYGTQNLQTGVTTSTGVKSSKATDEAGRNRRFDVGEAGKNTRHNDSEAQTNRRFVEGEKGKNQRSKATRKRAGSWYQEDGEGGSGATPQPQSAFQQQLDRAQQSPGWAKLKPEEQQAFIERLKQRYQQ